VPQNSVPKAEEAEKRAEKEGFRGEGAGAKGRARYTVRGSAEISPTLEETWGGKVWDGGTSTVDLSRSWESWGKNT